MNRTSSAMSQNKPFTRQGVLKKPTITALRHDSFRRIRRTALHCLLLALLATIASGTAFAQTGQITGRVTAQDGAVIPGAALTIRETETGQQRIVESNQDGYYTVPSLLPGPYSISVKSPGFQTLLRTGVQLQVEQTLQINITLRPGTVTQTVIVTAQAPLLATETSSTGQVIGGRDVVTLPLLGRDAYALGELVPGVRGSIGMNNLPVDVISTSAISINGARGSANDFLLDGAPNSAAAANEPVIYPIADSVQEFKVLTNNYSAEYGRSAGGIYDVVTKAGTNDLHFTAYEFYRNATLTANNWFAKAAGQPGPPLTFNQFGGVVGGPVVVPKLYNGHNKTFFLLGLEYVRFDQGNTYTAHVPTPAELTGDFSQDTNSKGQPVTIYNPFTTASNTRQAFSGNIIPPNLLNPIAVNMAKYFPKPNQTTLGVNNYILADEVLVHENEFTGRVDQVFNAKTTMFARYSFNNTPEIRPNPYGPGNMGGSGFGPQVFDRYNAIVGANHAFSSTLLGTIRASFARLTNQRGPISLGFNIATLGFPAGLAGEIGPPAAFPVVTISGYGVSGSVANVTGGNALGTTGLIAGFMNTFAVEANLTKTFGEHELNMGTDLRLLQANILQAADNSTHFDFTAAFTQGPTASQVSATAGDALASFLLGTPASGGVAPSPALALETKYYAAFIQDNWRVSNSLTLNLGMRYEFETPYTERFNRLSNFAPNATVPLTGVPGLHGALSFVGVDGNSRYDSSIQPNHYSPRLGFAWHARPKTVVSGGGGMFYDTVWGVGEAPAGYGISGFTATTSMVTTLDGVTPYHTLSNPYPSGLVPVSGSSLGSATLLGQAISATERNMLKTPYAVQWNLGIQQQLAANWILDVKYVGTHFVHEEANLELDQLPDSALALGTGLQTLVPNPFYGQIATGQLAAPKVSRAQLLRPYPQFIGVTSLNASWAGAHYNALEVTLQKRFSNGFSFLSAYTWSKLMDQASGGFGGETLGGGTIQDYNNLKAEMSTSLLDQTNRLVSGAVYQLPFFRQGGGLAGHLLGGWEFSTITSFISGDPLGITSATNGTDSQGGGQRPNWNGKNAALGNHTVAKWFDTSVFSTPPAFHFGNTPRTFDDLRSDWIRNIDVSLHKNTQLSKNMNLQIRVDAFNMDNTPTFAPPNTSFGSAQFGVVSAQQNTPRTIQLGFKLLY